MHANEDDQNVIDIMFINHRKNKHLLTGRRSKDANVGRRARNRDGCSDQYIRVRVNRTPNKLLLRYKINRCSRVVYAKCTKTKQFTRVKRIIILTSALITVLIIIIINCTLLRIMFDVVINFKWSVYLPFDHGTRYISDKYSWLDQFSIIGVGQIHTFAIYFIGQLK